MAALVKKQEVINEIKALFPTIDWPKFDDLDRSINWELYFGPLDAYNYWTEVEPLENYVWHGFNQATLDLVDLLEPLPQHIYIDSDDCIYMKDPADDSDNYAVECKRCEQILYHWDEIKCIDDNGHQQSNKDPFWVGPESYTQVDVRQYLMHDESWKQVF